MVMYDTFDAVDSVTADGGYSYSEIGRWKFQNKIHPFTNLWICQESRHEALKSGHLESYGLIDMGDDGPERAWYQLQYGYLFHGYKCD